MKLPPYLLTKKFLALSDRKCEALQISHHDGHGRLHICLLSEKLLDSHAYEPLEQKQNNGIVGATLKCYQDILCTQHIQDFMDPP